MTREEAIDIIKCLAWHTRPNEEDIEQAIRALEQPKAGHWISKGTLSAVCSCCNRNNALYGNYCKFCGAKMIEPQAESEEK